MNFKKFETGGPFQEVYSTERRMIHRKGEPDEQQVLGYLSHALDKHSLAQQSQQCCELQEKEEVDGILPSNFSLQLSTDDRNSLCLNG